MWPCNQTLLSLPADDYLECLHHRKEFGRLNAIHRERERKRKHPDGEHGKEH